MFEAVKKRLLAKKTLRHVKEYGKIVDDLLAKGAKIRAWKEEEERKSRKVLETTIPMDGY